MELSNTKAAVNKWDNISLTYAYNTTNSNKNAYIQQWQNNSFVPNIQQFSSYFILSKYLEF